MEVVVSVVIDSVTAAVLAASELALIEVISAVLSKPGVEPSLVVAISSVVLCELESTNVVTIVDPDFDVASADTIVDICTSVDDASVVACSDVLSSVEIPTDVTLSVNCEVAVLVEATAGDVISCDVIT